MTHGSTWLRSTVVPMRIDITVFDGFDELDAIGPLEVFKNAAAAGGAFSAQLVTRVPAVVVTGCHGLRVVPDGTFSAGGDMVFVPGGAWVARSDVGAWGEVQRGDWLPILAQAAREGALMASVCTGAMLLAHAGVIGTRRAGTHHSAWDDLAATGATVVPDRVVDDGHLLTAGGVTSGIDLALWIVERFGSVQLANAVSDQMEYPRVRPLTAPDL
jgi:transcriptional regulator GlxA family with amidase domain